MERQKIAVPTTDSPPIIRSCRNCKRNISHRRKNAKYCSDNCRKRWNQKVKEAVNATII